MIICDSKIQNTMDVRKNMSNYKRKQYIKRDKKRIFNYIF